MADMGPNGWRYLSEDEFKRWVDTDSHAMMQIRATLSYQLRVDSNGHVWNGGIGPGFGCIGRVELDR